MTLPRTPAEYQRHIAERLNVFERLMDKATGFDERQDLTNLLLMEILKISAEEKEVSPFPPALSRALIDHLTKDKPEFYKFIDIDLSTARTNEVYPEAGDFIWVDNQFARGEVTLRLNEEKFGKFDLRRQKYIQGPFYRFFINNVTGQGSIRLFISRGYQAASEPIEAMNRAELAARLGSPVTFDRRGDVIWFDDFESGDTKWYHYFGGVAGETGVTAKYARNGAFSLKLNTGTGGMASAVAIAYLPMPVFSKMGIELSFTQDAELGLFRVYFRLNSIVRSYLPHIQYDDPNDKLQLLDRLLGWVDIITNLKLSRESRLFHTLKLVEDPTTGKYVRLTLNGKEYDVSTYEMPFVAGVDDQSMNPEIQVYPKGTDATEVCVDDVIITQNEP